jgi:hypothetical protein
MHFFNTYFPQTSGKYYIIAFCHVLFPKNDCIFWFSLEGMLKLSTNFSGTRDTYHDTLVRDNWLVRQCHLVLIASATEIVNGLRTYGNLELPWVTMLILILDNTCLLPIVNLSALLNPTAGQIKVLV